MRLTRHAATRRRKLDVSTSWTRWQTARPCRPRPAPAGNSTWTSRACVLATSPPPTPGFRLCRQLWSPETDIGRARRRRRQPSVERHCLCHRCCRTCNCQSPASRCLATGSWVLIAPSSLSPPYYYRMPDHVTNHVTPVYNIVNWWNASKTLTREGMSSAKYLNKETRNKTAKYCTQDYFHTRITDI